MLSKVGILTDLISEPDGKRIADVPHDKEIYNNSNNSHLPESSNKTYSYPPKNKTCEETRHVTVPYSRPRFTKSQLQGRLHIFTMSQEISHSFKKENIAIDSHS